MAVNEGQGAVGPVGGPAPLRGQVVYLYAFDLAYDMKREPVARLLGEPVKEYSIGPSKRSPKHLLFYRPQMVNLPTAERTLLGKTVAIERSVKLFGVGAISIQVRAPFEVDRLEVLVQYHDAAFTTGDIEQEVRELAEQVRKELLPYCIRPVPRIQEGEAYTVFCLDAVPSENGPPKGARAWLAENRRQVAALLAHETDAGSLSMQSVRESTNQWLSYYDSDLVVVDWDAALVVGERESLDDVLHIMALANVQLLELSVYDQILDSSLERAYRHMVRWGRRSPRVRRSLREIRIDLARLSDELSNITKFFGDWRLARIYGHLSLSFHLADWHRIIAEKLRTLADLYELLQQDRRNFWMVVLEAAIILLFVIDLVVLFMQLSQARN